MFDQHYQKAKEYDNVSLFAECIKEVNSALQIARDQDWEEKEIAVNIFLAEIKRKTNDYNEGLIILKNLERSPNYPKLHVKKLGRMSALINEGVLSISDREKKILIRQYLDSALLIAINLNLRSEQASLLNELGYTLGSQNVDSCLKYLSTAAQLFLEEKDTQNYVGARTNMLRTYETFHDSINVMNTFNELISLVKGRAWHTAERELYRVMVSYYRKQSDTNRANYWQLQCDQSNFSNLQSISSTQLDSYRALYETNKYQDEAFKKAELLKKEEHRRKELIAYFSVLVGLCVVVLFLLFRERKLKRAVDKANEKYHMLIVESNHRIKNNLQMIISMLEYAGKGLSEHDTLAFKRMSGKIQTISALHEHLYLDVHNAKVDLSTYFEGIISLYDEINNNALKIVKMIVPVSIHSERIIYFGLIFNEMLSNTLEHNNSQDGIIYIYVKHHDDHFQFTYQDHSSFDSNLKGGTGINLIKQLIKRVEGFNFKVEGKVGKYQFKFYD